MWDADADAAEEGLARRAPGVAAAPQHYVAKGGGPGGARGRRGLMGGAKPAPTKGDSVDRRGRCGLSRENFDEDLSTRTLSNRTETELMRKCNQTSTEIQRHVGQGAVSGSRLANGGETCFGHVPNWDFGHGSSPTRGPGFRTKEWRSQPHSDTWLSS